MEVTQPVSGRDQPWVFGLFDPTAAVAPATAQHTASTIHLPWHGVQNSSLKGGKTISEVLCRQLSEFFKLE